MIFLLNTCEFHIMQFNHIQVPVLPGLSTNLVTFTPSNPGHTHKKVLSSICVAHILTEHVQTPSGKIPLKKTESFPTHIPPEAINCGEPHFSVLSHILRVPLNGFLSRMLFFGSSGDRDCHRSLVYPSFSTVSL